MRLSFWHVIAAAPGAALGLGLYTFGYARGYSYLLDDSAACANCHVMAEQYERWLKGSHRGVASCNDCHTPSGTLGKYGTKALNGFNHSLAFTTGRFAEPIRANALNRKVARQACSKCHASVVDSMHAPSSREQDLADCTRCHGAVGHPD